MIREIDASELAECLHVIHKGYEPIAEQFHLTSENCPHRGRAALPLDVLTEEYLAGTKMYVYEIDDCIVAFASVVLKNDAIKLNDIVVLPEFWHEGIGTAMLDFVKNITIDRHLSKVALGMIDDNIVLKKWYEKNGFVNAGYHQFPNAPFTVGYMEWKNVDPPPDPPHPHSNTCQ